MFNCGSCAHFFSTEERTGKGSGECRFNPPVVFLTPMETLQGQGMGFTSVRPMVRKDNFCSHYTEGAPFLSMKA